MRTALKTYWITAFVGIALVFLIHPWHQTKIIEWDVTQYYIYLPATFIHQDLKQEKNWNFDLKPYNIELTPESSFKMTSGVAILYTPFFLSAHAFALLSLDYEANGFTLPYAIALSVGSVLFILLGFWFLTHFLLYYFNDKVTAWIIVILYFGTNFLFFNVWRGAMSHGYTFTLMSALLFTFQKYFERQSVLRAFILGLLMGLICLIRPVNLLAVLPVILYFFLMFKQEKKPINFRHSLIVIAAGIAAISPQLFYWKYATGSWIYYSYSDEGFFFGNPQILDGLFSFRKGWLLYTPIMAFALIGFYPLYKKNKTFFWSIAPFFLLFVYVSFSWWCWWYGGSFGQRVFIDVFPLLALPLGSLLTTVFQNKLAIRTGIITILVLLISLNIFQSWQAQRGIIHFDSMTKKAYFHTFLKTEHQQNLGPMLQPPNYEKAMKGDGSY